MNDGILGNVGLGAGSISTGTLSDARLSSNIATYASVASYLNNPTGVVDIYPRGESSSGSVVLNNGSLALHFFTPMQNISVSRITIPTGAVAAVTTTFAQFGLYSFNETTATLLARCDSDNTLFAAINTLYTRSFSTTGGYPASYTLQAGTRYGIGLLVIATTMPQFAGKGVAQGAIALTPRLTSAVSGQSSLPTSVTAGVVSGPVYLARLS